MTVWIPLLITLIALLWWLRDAHLAGEGYEPETQDALVWLALMKSAFVSIIAWLVWAFI